MSWVAQSVLLRDGRPEFDSRQGQKIFLYSTVFRPDLGLAQPPIIQWVLESFFPELKRMEREVSPLPPSSAEVKNVGAIHQLIHMSSWCNS
jgi:hypothetical protein